MAELKTKKTDNDVNLFISSIPDERKRNDCIALIEIMRKITKAEPKIWGSSIVGFGSFHYKYASGRGGDWFLTGFSPRKGNLSIYLMSGFSNSEDILPALGKFKTGKGCLYVKSLNDIDINILKDLVKKSVKELQTKYGS